MKQRAHFCRQITTALCFLFLSSTAFSQTTGRITGLVQGEGSKELSGVTVSLLKAADSALVKVALSDSRGQYELEHLKEGAYLLSFTSVGYEPRTTTVFQLAPAAQLQQPVVVLTPAARALSGVTVQSRRPLVENKIDKMVVNVDASPTNAGATALEVLEKSPGVSVDRDGNISIKGKQGVIVLIDGKQTYLSGQDLANLLRNMPASELDQVEIMTQPSAKYDASGTAGILNLRTKKSLARGFNGSVNLSYVQGHTPKTPNSVAFNYRTSKINLFTNASYSYWSGYQDQQLLRKFRRNGVLSSVFDQEADQNFHSNNFSARIGLDYTLNKTTTLGAMIKGNNSPSYWENNGRADIFNGTGALDSFNVVQSINHNTWQNIGANLNFRKVLNTTGRELTADLDRINYTMGTRQTSDNYTFLPDKTYASDPYLLRGNLPADITIYSGKADYTHPLTKESKVEAGVKSSYVHTDNDAQYTLFSRAEGKWVVDNSKSNRFKYEEYINAAYVNYSRQIRKWGVQTGLRMENTSSRGHQMGNAVQKDSAFRKNYTQLFPTAYLSYALNDNNQFGLSYGRRIERPSYQDMNPFQFFLDQYTYMQGNPALAPQFTHNIELSHNFHKVLHTTVNYTATTDIINDILKQNNATKVTFQTKENIGKRQTLGLALSYNAPLTKWWTTSVYLNVNRNHYQGMVNNGYLDVSLSSFMGYSSQQFRFAKTWSAEVNGFYRTSAQETGLFLLRPMGVVSFGFGKQLLHNKASLKLSVNDPFYLQRVKVIIDYHDIDTRVYNRWDNRHVGLTFTYRFSKGQSTPAPQSRTSSAQEEQNRVKSNSNQ